MQHNDQAQAQLALSKQTVQAFPPSSLFDQDLEDRKVIRKYSIKFLKLIKVIVIAAFTGAAIIVISTLGASLWGVQLKDAVVYVAGVCFVAIIGQTSWLLRGATSGIFSKFGEPNDKRY